MSQKQQKPSKSGSGKKQLTINAAGASFPPFFLFPMKNMQSKFIKHASTGSVGYANSSGHMKQPEFVMFMHHFIRYTHASKTNPQLLLLDNHTSHLSIEALDMIANSVKCNSCERPVHLKCVRLNAGGWTCENCVSE